MGQAPAVGGSLTPPRDSSPAPLFRLFLILSGVLLAAVLVDLGGMLYWHVRVTRAVRPADPPEDPLEVLYSARCRALAPLVGKVADAEPARLSALTWGLAVAVTLSEPVDDPPLLGQTFLMPSPEIHLVRDDDWLELQEWKRRRILEWWEANRDRYPPRWQFWRSRRGAP